MTSLSALMLELIVSLADERSRWEALELRPVGWSVRLVLGREDGLRIVRADSYALPWLPWRFTALSVRVPPDHDLAVPDRLSGADKAALNRSIDGFVLGLHGPYSDARAFFLRRIQGQPRLTPPDRDNRGQHDPFHNGLTLHLFR